MLLVFSLSLTQIVAIRAVIDAEVNSEMAQKANIKIMRSRNEKKVLLDYYNRID